MNRTIEKSANAFSEVEIYRKEIAFYRLQMRRQVLGWIREMISNERIEDVALITGLMSEHGTSFYKLLTTEPEKLLGSKMHEPVFSNLIITIQDHLKEIGELYVDARYKINGLRLMKIQKIDVIREGMAKKLDQFVTKHPEERSYLNL